MEEYADRMKKNSFKSKKSEQKEYAEKLFQGPKDKHYCSIVNDAKVLDKPLEFMKRAASPKGNMKSVMLNRNRS